MAKRIDVPPKSPETNSSTVRARAALDSVIESIHDEHRMLEGEDLIKAIYEIFADLRPKSAYKESK